ncbi:alpha/beta fold hydrolase [Paenibacillus peoriae]|uniref:alpha/beta hydrolase n=1 Tax=Paenibacillus peoriae TaxID=59893 RepID=UPI00026C67CD|nr:alpha/beta hydrolase [Paenibacillus peoriae]MEC0180745.1 alpha/beta fold hydrolase [Paenibacillus peoriae]
MKIIKRALLIVLSILMIVLTGIFTFAATPLSTCQFPNNVVSNVASDGVGQSGANMDNRLATDHVQYVESNDHIRLAYRSYVPANPKAVVIFYHGSGANSAAGYQPIGEQLSQNYGIATYLPDIRGHGLSGGDRGDAPSVDQVYDDITSIIDTAHRQFPSVPVFLGGHSAGAGLVVNYIHSPHHESVNGYLFVAPDFGPKSNTMYEGNGNFATVCTKAFVAHELTGGLFKGHAAGVRYNYSEEQMKSGIGFVQYNSVNMALTLNPGRPSQEVAGIDRPFGLWVGAEDEIMNPQKVVAFAKLATQVSHESSTTIVPGEKHLTILNHAAKLIGPWVLQAS